MIRTWDNETAVTQCGTLCHPSGVLLYFGVFPGVTPQTRLNPGLSYIAPQPGLTIPQPVGLPNSITTAASGGNFTVPSGTISRCAATFHYVVRRIIPPAHCCPIVNACLSNRNNPVLTRWYNQGNGNCRKHCGRMPAEYRAPWGRHKIARRWSCVSSGIPGAKRTKKPEPRMG